MNSQAAADLKKITVIIPAHNRPKHLTRTLDYYSGTDLKIIVIDSSEEIFKNRGRFKRVAYHYLRNSSGSSLAKKVCLALKKINTRYSVICSEDDFVNPRGILNCVQFLEKNPRYVSAQGHFVSFINNKGKIAFNPSYRYIRNTNIRQKFPCSRVRAFFKKYMQLLYAVHRTKNLRNIFKIIVKNKIKNYNLHELMMGVMTIVAGRHRVLNIFYASREKIPRKKNVSRLTSNPAHYLETWELAKRKEFRADFYKFINIVAKFLEKKTCLTFYQSRRFILKSHKEYSRLQKFGFKKTMTFFSKIISMNYLKNYLKEAAIKQMARAYFFYHHFLKDKDRETVKKRARIKRVFAFFKKRDFEDLERIERLVRKYNITYE
ncbi:TIGR00180 family glycosyltransferase [Patescibacteria group bacterium]|nr:TIGR00180 family glycosyltransferase [Patescibacteria group bacterium]